MRIGGAAALILVLLAASCESGTDSPIIPPGPRTFVFGMHNIPDAQGQFLAATSDAAVLQKLAAQLALPAADRNLHISGPIERGTGSDNLSWHWRFVESRWDMVEVSIELCDGTPEMVEQDVDKWVQDVGVFCPWNSYVQREL